MWKVVTNKVLYSHPMNTKKTHIGWSLYITYNDHRYTYYQYLTNSKKANSVSARNYFKLIAVRNYSGTQYCDLVCNYFEKNKNWHKKAGLNG